MLLRWLGWACLLRALWPGASWGADRLIRQWTEDDGLPVRWTTDVAQDATGYIWLATRGGLVRWDADRFQQWTTFEATQVATGPGDVLLVAHTDGSLIDLTDRDAPLRVDLPEGVGDTDLRSMAIDQDGTWWVGWDAGVWRREADRWQLALDLGGQRLRNVRARPGEPVLAIAANAVWSVSGDPAVVWDRGGLGDVTRRSDGSWVGVSRAGDVIVRRDGTERVLAQESYGSTLVPRGDAVWAATEQRLIRVGPDDRTDTIRLRRDQGAAFELLVDREGSLWIASGQGLLQLPEPDTSVWTEDDGLPLYLVDDILPALDGSLFVVTREYLARLARSADDWHVTVFDDVFKPSRPCLSGDGTLWTAGLTAEGGAFLTIDGAGARTYPIGREAGSAVCTTDDEGTVWLASGRAVYEAGDPPRLVGATPAWGHTFPALYADSTDRLWWLHGPQACATPLAALREAAPSWTCIDNPDGSALAAAFEVVPGRMWIAGRHGPPLRLTDAGLEPLDVPAGGIVRGFSPSPRGGVWVFGVQTLYRGVPGPQGWEIVERLGSAQGVADTTPHDVYEEPDGTVWLATLSGLIRVPSEARVLPDAAPAVHLVEASSDGAPVPHEGVVLPYRNNRLTLRFSALSYRDPARVRYRLRLGDGDAQVVDDAELRFVDLAPGRYRARVTASVNGEHWSSWPAEYAFKVRAPWYLQAWALALWLTLAAGLVYAAHRARVAYLVGLERQRARIAMDLHDEIGSGLGSIGLLAGVLRDAPSAAAPTGLATTIAKTAEDLGTSLTEIVWALRRDAASPDALLSYLEARARGMFVGGTTRVEVSAPDRWPRVALSLSVRRNLQSIALEALHNAAKHAAASSVELGMAPGRGTWRLWVTDDGVGLDGAAAPRPGGGTGLDSMRRRAQAIGGTLEVTSGPGGGTTVSVRFEPGATDRRMRAP